MESREHPRITPGLDVFDLEGHKVGTVAHLHDGASDAPAVDGFFEMKTGFFGLGKHYYVPYRAVKDITTGGAFLKRSRSDFDALGWATKPQLGIRPDPDVVRPTRLSTRVSPSGTDTAGDTDVTAATTESNTRPTTAPP
ncbi:MAG TPA: hypothetical protein VFN74_17835 [Chloroflexota bacterium]|nr:hypothetical protein [Chloroflexota bacterium]